MRRDIQMTDSLPEPRSLADANPGAMHGVPRAGTPARQVALQDAGWEMLEAHRPARARLTTRLSNTWIGDNGWRAQVVPHYLMEHEEWLTPLLAAIRVAGHEHLLGTNVSPNFPRPSAVWRLPLDERLLANAIQAHSLGVFLLFPEDRSFAILCDDVDTATYAGPEAFLRAALPADAVGAAMTQEVKEGTEQEYGPGTADDILAWYEPFLLEA